MILADLSSVGSFISALAVAGSLIYLGLQTHQAAKHTRALIAQGRASRTMDWAMKSAEPDFATAIIKSNGGTPTPEAVTQAQFFAISGAVFMSADESFNQHEVGLLDDHQFGSFRGTYAGILSLSGYRQAWSRWKAARPDANPRFIAFMDDVVAKTKVVSYDAAVRAAETASAASTSQTAPT